MVFLTLQSMRENQYGKSSHVYIFTALKHLKVIRPFCKPKFWSCVDLLSFKRKWLLKTSLEVVRLEIDF